MMGDPYERNVFGKRFEPNTWFENNDYKWFE
jgi:hypothetical protein